MTQWRHRHKSILITMQHMTQLAAALLGVAQHSPLALPVAVPHQQVNSHELRQPHKELKLRIGKL